MTYSRTREIAEQALRQALDTLGVDPYAVDQMAWEGAVNEMTEAIVEIRAEGQAPLRRTLASIQHDADSTLQALVQ